MTTFMIEVHQTVLVTIDATKFDENFMAEFRAGFYPFQDIKDHAEHLAQLMARGLVDTPDDFIEGYGPMKEMGIALRITNTDMEVIDEVLS